MPSVNGLFEGQETVSWEYHSVTLHRVPGYGFGIAVSGGRDNPHFANGDPAIAISDVLKGGPADHKLILNDRILSANGVSLENVDYATAIQVLRDNSVVQLVIKRRIVTHSNLANEFDSLHFTLNRNTHSLNTNTSKKYTLEDFGVQIAAQLVITTKHRNLQVGDIITSINNNSIENKSISDLKKLLEKTSLSKLDLVLKRKKQLPQQIITNHQQTFYTNENLYVQPPRRANGLYTNPSNPNVNQNPNPNVNPLLDIEPIPILPGMDHRFDNIPPPRPPLPVEEDMENPPISDLGGIVQQNGGTDYNYLVDPANLVENFNPSGPRLISFHKKGSVGIRLAGGNSVGIFVTAVQPNSPASLHLQPGDCILSVNTLDLTNYTREEAVDLLMSLNNKVNLKIITKLQEYNHIIENNIGDSFYIRTHFDYTNLNSNMSNNELEFKSGDVFHVIDTLYNGAVGFWEVVNINTNEKGIILNKKSAKLYYNNLIKSGSGENKTLFFIKRRNKKADSDEQFFECYEKVMFRHPGFKRPAILFGPTADVARERLAREFTNDYMMPAFDSTTKAIKLTQIRGIIDKGRHGLLDVNPTSVNKLNYAGVHPIIILLKIDNKLLIKNIRANNKIGDSSRSTDTAKKISTSKLYEESLKFEKNWSHLLTATLNITNSDTWFRELKELIDNEQRKHIWMSDERSHKDSSEQFDVSVAAANLEDYSFTSHSANLNQHYDTLPRSSNSVSVEEFDRSLTLNQINKLHSDEILLPNYNEPPPYAINTSTTALYPEQPHIEEIRETKVKKDKYRDHYNGKSRMSNKLNYIPVLAHSPIIGGHSGSPYSEGPAKPPKVDRTKKPRSATERLFGENSNSIRSSVTPERNGGLTKAMVHENHNHTATDEQESFYDNYRYTRPLPPTGGNGFNHNETNKHHAHNMPHYGQIFPSSTDGGSPTSDGHQDMNKNESPYTIFNSKTLEEMKPARASFKNKNLKLNGQLSDYDGIYNNAKDDRELETTHNGRSPYHNNHDSNDNPYKSVQPNQKSRLAGMKPVPPPKPAKPIRSDLHLTSKTSISNSFYLNVPINLGNREQSAFELYRKAKRDGAANANTAA